MVASLTAPQPEQPNPVEIQSWLSGANNARQQYDQQSARSTYLKNQATNTYGLQNRQATYANQQQRQQFDDPYIGRGIFNSGIRRGGLSNMLTNQAFGAQGREMDYAQAMGGYGLDDYLARQTRDTTLENLAAQEQARRTQLAAEIKGIQ